MTIGLIAAIMLGTSGWACAGDAARQLGLNDDTAGRFAAPTAIAYADNLAANINPADSVVMKDRLPGGARVGMLDAWFGDGLGFESEAGARAAFAFWKGKIEEAGVKLDDKCSQVWIGSDPCGSTPPSGYTGKYQFTIAIQGSRRYVDIFPAEKQVVNGAEHKYRVPEFDSVAAAKEEMGKYLEIFAKHNIPAPVAVVYQDGNKYGFRIYYVEERQQKWSWLPSRLVTSPLRAECGGPGRDMAAYLGRVTAALSGKGAEIVSAGVDSGSTAHVVYLRQYPGSEDADGSFTATEQSKPSLSWSSSSQSKKMAQRIEALAAQNSVVVDCGVYMPGVYRPCVGDTCLHLPLPQKFYFKLEYIR